MKVFFTFEGRQIDAVEVDEAALSSRSAYVSVDVPPEVAGRGGRALRDGLVVVDERGRRFTLDVDGRDGDLRLFRMLNGYLRPEGEPSAHP